MSRILNYFGAWRGPSDRRDTGPSRADLLRLGAEAGWADLPLLERLLDRVEGRR